MTRLSQSIAAGILIPIAIFVVVFLTDSGDSMLTLVERHPLACALFWPDLIWCRVLNSDAAAAKQRLRAPSCLRPEWA